MATTNKLTTSLRKEIGIMSPDFVKAEKESSKDLTPHFVIDAWNKYKLYIEWHREDCKELFSELEKAAIKWIKKCK